MYYDIKFWGYVDGVDTSTARMRPADHARWQRDLGHVFGYAEIGPQRRLYRFWGSIEELSFLIENWSWHGSESERARGVRTPDAEAAIQHWLACGKRRLGRAPLAAPHELREHLALFAESHRPTGDDIALWDRLRALADDVRYALMMSEGNADVRTSLAVPLRGPVLSSMGIEEGPDATGKMVYILLETVVPALNRLHVPYNDSAKMSEGLISDIKTCVRFIELLAGEHWKDFAHLRLLVRRSIDVERYGFERSYRERLALRIYDVADRELHADGVMRVKGTGEIVSMGE